MPTDQQRQPATNRGPGTTFSDLANRARRRSNQNPFLIQ